MSTLLKITTDKATLRRNLAIGKITGGARGDHPALENIHFAVTGHGNIVTQSTDRYILSRTLVPITGRPVYSAAFKKDGAALPLSSARFVEKWLPLVGTRTPVVVTVDDAHRWTFAAEGAPTISNVPGFDGDYPPLEKIAGGDTTYTAAERDRSGLAALNPHHFHRIGKIGTYAHRGHPMILQVGKKSINESPTVGFRFTSPDGEVWCDGILMGVRYPADIECPGLSKGL